MYVRDGSTRLAPAPVGRGRSRQAVRARPGVVVRRAVATLGDSDTDQGLGWGWHPFKGWSIKKLGKGITQLGHNIGKVVTSKPFQLVEGGALALTGVGLPAAAAIMGGTKGIGNLIKPGGNLKHFATGVAQGAVEGAVAHEAGAVGRGVTKFVRGKFAPRPPAPTGPAALTPAITPPAPLVATAPLAPPLATLPAAGSSATDIGGSVASTAAAILTRRATGATDTSGDALATAPTPVQTVSTTTAQNAADATAAAPSTPTAPTVPEISGGGASYSGDGGDGSSASAVTSNGDVIDTSTPQLMGTNTGPHGEPIQTAADGTQYYVDALTGQTVPVAGGAPAGMSKGKMLALGAGVAALAVGAIHFSHKPGGRR